MLLVPAFAVFSACAPDDPHDASECAWVLGSGAKKDCMAQVAINTFRSDPIKGIAFTEEQIADVLQRDFVYLQVTMQVDASTNKYCDRIVDPVFKERCTTRVQRPHLNRAESGGPRN